MAKAQIIGIDLFSGAGGMSIGAISAGIDVRIAVEIDRFAGLTYKSNHKNTLVFNDDIRKFRIKGILKTTKRDIKIIFGGPPCQGFSTSNQKTRNMNNSNNWLFKEYLRITKEVLPDWVVVENVKGIIDTENGYFFNEILNRLNRLGYTTNWVVLNAADYGVPQIRNRVFIVGSLDGIKFDFPKPTCQNYITVEEAISDLPKLESGAMEHELDYKTNELNKYQSALRKQSSKSVNNLVTKNSKLIIERYKHIPQGGNWHNIPVNLMMNYKDCSRCHTRIYHRLEKNKPAVVLGNYRKNMLIHPTENRGLSVREAARLQSFPDSFHFWGGIGTQQQQVGNSVPPILASVLFNQIYNYCV